MKEIEKRVDKNVVVDVVIVVCESFLSTPLIFLEFMS